MDKRSPNFTNSEVDFLLQIVKKYSNVLESKKNDRFGTEEKLAAWKGVEREFNSKFSHVFRSHKVLKTKYFNIKAIAKQNYAFDKRQTYKTGGGPMQKTATTKTDEIVLEICQEAQILGRTSEYDDNDASENESKLHNVSDTDMKPIPLLNEEELDAAAEEYVFETLLLNDTQTSFPTAQQNTISSPHQEQPAPILKKKKSTPTTCAPATVDVWEQVAHKKLKKLESEIKVIEEEWKLRKQKLELEIEGVRLENRLKEENLNILKQKQLNTSNKNH